MGGMSNKSLLAKSEIISKSRQDAIRAEQMAAQMLQYQQTFEEEKRIRDRAFNEEKFRDRRDFAEQSELDTLAEFRQGRTAESEAALRGQQTRSLSGQNALEEDPKLGRERVRALSVEAARLQNGENLVRKTSREEFASMTKRSMEAAGLGDEWEAWEPVIHNPDSDLSAIKTAITDKISARKTAVALGKKLESQLDGWLLNAPPEIGSTLPHDMRNYMRLVVDTFQETVKHLSTSEQSRHMNEAWTRLQSTMNTFASIRSAAKQPEVEDFEDRLYIELWGMNKEEVMHEAADRGENSSSGSGVKSTASEFTMTTKNMSPANQILFTEAWAKLRLQALESGRYDPAAVRRFKDWAIENHASFSGGHKIPGYFENVLGKVSEALGGGTGRYGQPVSKQPNVFGGPPAPAPTKTPAVKPRTIGDRFGSSDAINPNRTGVQQ